MSNYTIFQMFENPRRGRKARNFTTNVPKIINLKSSSEQIFSENWRWVPLTFLMRFQFKVIEAHLPQEAFMNCALRKKLGNTGKTCQISETWRPSFLSKQQWLSRAFSRMRINYFTNVTREMSKISRLTIPGVGPFMRGDLVRFVNIYKRTVPSRLSNI